MDGRGTLSVVLTRRFKDARARLADAVRAFERLGPMDMTDVHAGGGTGGSLDAFRRPMIGPPSLGEAAGFQDYLWGFGIRHALHSGDVAARAFAGGNDYAEAAAGEIMPLIRASLRLRALYDRVGDRGDRMLIRHLATAGDPGTVLRRAYAVAGVQARFRPLASVRRSTQVAS